MTRHVVCDIDQLPVGGHVLATLGGRTEVGVFNVHGRLVAVRNACPHAGGPLCRGELTGAAVSEAPRSRRWAHEGEILKCPWHGWEFRLPEAVTLTDPPVRARTYPVTVEDGKVVVELGAARHAEAS